jgi:threonine dehydrogenase-like Zn-dependent dehydrogenase
LTSASPRSAQKLDILGARNALRVFPAVIQMMERRQQAYTGLVTRIYLFNQAARALRDWDAAPGEFTKILIDVAMKK